MTAAAIGSRLGAAGTIIGAAAASVVAAVAGAIYTASLRHTHAKVRTVWSGRWSAGIPGAVETISDRANATAANAGPQHIAPRRRGPLFPGRLRFPWKPAAVGALLAFGIAAATLTGLELISGHALSGGEGTTVTQVTQRDAGSDPAKPDPKAEAKDKTPASSSEPTRSPEPSTSTSSSPEETTPTPNPEPTTTTPVPTAGPLVGTITQRRAALGLGHVSVRSQGRGRRGGGKAHQRARRLTRPMARRCRWGRSRPRSPVSAACHPRRAGHRAARGRAEPPNRSGRALSARSWSD